MTDAERRDMDANPLWTLSGQIRWYLDQREGDDLVHATQIAADLEALLADVSARLHELEGTAAISSHPVGGRQHWGTHEQVQRLLAAERQVHLVQAGRIQRIVDDNEELDAIGIQMAEARSGKGIEVTSLRRMFPCKEADSRPEYLVVTTSDPESASWLLDTLRESPDPDDVDDADWETLWAQFGHLLRGVTGAGWSADEEYCFAEDVAGWSADDQYCFAEDDLDDGPSLYMQLRRTCMVLGIEYMPSRRALRFLPVEADFDEIDCFSMLDEVVVIELVGGLEEQSVSVTDAAGDLGLLDATRIAMTSEKDDEVSDFMTIQYVSWMFSPAAERRKSTVEDLMTDLSENKTFSRLWNMVIAGGERALPDCVPAAAARGISAWCWRNDWPVEKWHLENDVLMAKVNMAVTSVVRRAIDPITGIDWDVIKNHVTSPSWTLPDGRSIAEQFGMGWPEVVDGVLRNLDTWRDIDQHLLGADATMRFMTIAGSTSYTDRWWGQGRWRTLCRAVIDDAIHAGIELPTPYDALWPESLLEATRNPSQLDDGVLHWLIDMPQGGIDGPRGTRDHRTRMPIVRLIG